MNLEEALTKISVITTYSYQQRVKAAARLTPEEANQELTAFQAKLDALDEPIEGEVIYPQQRATEVATEGDGEDLCPTCATPEAIREEDSKHPMGWVCSICGCGWPPKEDATLEDEAGEEEDEMEEDLHSALELLEAAQTFLQDLRRNTKAFQKLGWKLEQEFNALELDLHQFLEDWIELDM